MAGWSEQATRGSRTWPGTSIAVVKSGWPLLGVAGPALIVAATVATSSWSTGLDVTFLEFALLTVTGAAAIAVVLGSVATSPGVRCASLAFAAMSLVAFGIGRWRDYLLVRSVTQDPEIDYVGATPSVAQGVGALLLVMLGVALALSAMWTVSRSASPPRTALSTFAGAFLGLVAQFVVPLITLTLMGVAG